MFRRKDELDMDNDLAESQGSLLAAETETVSVLSPEKAAEYKAEKEKTTVPETRSQEQSNSASFSSPASISQTARPISRVSDVMQQTKPSYTSPSQSATVATPVSRPSSFRPATPDTQRFRPVGDTSRAVATPTSTSNFSSESNSMLNKHNQNERVLTVGNDILLKGEITTCDRLVIEGNVDATVSDVHTMELLDSGSFKGNAEVEYAEISGVFEGNLVVRNSLVIHKNGKVSGNITYGEIEIAKGGQITGEIKSIQASQASRSQQETKAAA